FFITYQLKLVENWRLQQAYFGMIRECVRTRPTKLVIVDAAAEELRVSGSEPIFDWSTSYIPFILEKEVSTARNWPLVQAANFVAAQGKLVGTTIHLKGLYTWFVYPTEMDVPISDVMIVKPLEG